MAVPPYIIPYDPHFLGGGVLVPLPEPSERLRDRLYTVNGSHVIDYTHFSLAMHKERHTAVYSACNIDGRRIVKGAGGSKSWKLDDRLGDHQLGPEAYLHTAWNRGHLSKREDVVWGTPKEAREANSASFFFANAAPQHRNFNQDEWKKLEDWIFENWASEDQYRLCVLTGPVLKRTDRTLAEGDPEVERRVTLDPEDIHIPAAFWKIVALRDAASDDLAVAAFAMRQTDLWADRDGGRLLRLSVHQVTVDAISRWTDLDFGPLHEADVLRIDEDRTLFARESSGQMIWPIIRSADDLIAPSRERRLERSAPRGTGTTTLRSASPSGECGCEQTADLQAAVEALSRDVARLTVAVAGQLAPAGGGERTLRTTVAAEAPNGGANAPQDEQRQLEDVFRLLDVDMRTTDLVRIVGGDEVDPGDFRSTCCLGSYADWYCTGVLIHPRVVITAAHCESDLTSAFFGGPNIPPLGGRETPMNVLKTIVHPSYDRRAFVRNDISVVILEKECPEPPAARASDAELAAATDTELVGFGYSDPARPVGFGTKRRVNVPIAAVRGGAGDTALVERTLGFSLNHEYVAGRKLLGRDSCKGDSGGPSYIRAGDQWKVAGVTSRATREATRTAPCGNGGIYVRIDAYFDWIRGVAQGFGITLS